MKENVRRCVALGVYTAAMLSQNPALFAGAKAEDVQMQDMDMSRSDLEFQGKLSGDAVETYILMSNPERRMAMQIASHGCKGKNSCKGQGGCKSESNSCKGQNSCKGKGSCKVSASDAVMMAKKRAQ